MRSLSRPLTLSIAGLGLVGALAGCASTATTDTSTADDTTNADDATSTDSGSSTDSGTGSDSSGSGDATYTDGTYTAEGSYQNPGGTSTIGVELTIADGVVTAVTVTPEADNGTSKGFQTQFANGIADEIVGEELATLSVDRVSGSSLTSQGFNEAVETIKSEAAA